MFDAQLPYQIKYTTGVPAKTGPLWYSIDLSVRVGLLVVLPLLGDAFCAAAGPTSVVRPSASIETSPMSFVFMIVFLCVSVNGCGSSIDCYRTNGFLPLGTWAPSF